MCLYHANFILAADALHKIAPNVPKYDDGFVAQFLCQQPSMDCWFSSCNKCSGITVKSLKDAVRDIPMSTNASWVVWNKYVPSTVTKQQKEKLSSRIEQRETAADLIAHLAALSPHFLKHSFIKREQAATFNLHDRPRAENSEYALEALLQIDFAENYVCESQDEVQSAHWNQCQLTLFTSFLCYNDITQSKVLISNNKEHTKDTIIPYIINILMKLPTMVKILKIWSDGPSSQFKNRFIANAIEHLEKKFELKIIWNYFATSHGKGCVDGIGATVKSIVRKHVKARDCIVNNASDFVQAFNRTKSKIIVEELTDEDFNSLNEDFGSADIFAKARNIRDISSAHQIQIIDGKIIIHESSKQGYN